MRLLDPWFLLLLSILPFIFLLLRKPDPGASLQYSSNHAADGLPKTLRTRLSFLPLVLRILTFVCIVVGLTRPVIGRETAASASKGIAIEMVIDRSGSMGSKMQYQGRSESRLEVVKQVFRTFVNGNGHDLRGRPSDLIGLVTFARYADTICPLTLDHRTLDAFLKQIHLPVRPHLDGTAIGDGIALAAAHLKALGSELAGATGRRYHVQSKVIILLTDGQNNFGRLSPMAAARLAKKWGIQVYTIGIGGSAGTVTVNTILGPQVVQGQSDLNRSMLEKIAADTGGAFQIAANGSTLEAVYRRIDRLQKSTLKSNQFVNWKELYLPFVIGAFGLILFEVLLENSLLRRIP